MNHQPTEPESPFLPAHRRFGLWVLLSLAMVVGLAGLAGLVLTGRMVAMPGWVTAQVESRLNAQLAPVGVRLGGLDVMFARNGVPQVHLSDIVILDGAGRDVARLPELNATLEGRALLGGQIAVRQVALSGAQLTLRRAPGGQFDLALGDSGAPVTAAGSLAEVLDEIDRAFATPALASVRGLSVEALQLTYEDARAGRIWTVENGLLTLEQSAQDVALRAFFSLRGEAELPAELAFSFISVKGTPEARFSANFSDVTSADVASQSPALAALALIDAPISGAIRTQVDAMGLLGPLSAALEIGAGVLQPAGGAPPIRFDAGKSYFTYDPGTERIRFDQIALDTAVLRFSAEGQAFLEGMAGGWPEALIGQLAFREVALDPEGVFERPAAFNGGALDIKVQLDPLTATIGQVVLLDGDQAYRGTGRVRALAQGWDVALDVTLDAITDKRLLALWPVGLAPGTRKWFSDNVLAGDLYDVHVALRRAAEGPARITLSHAFREADVQFLKTMPAVQGGRGYSTIENDAYTLVVEEGTIPAPDGGQVDVAGTVMHVPDVTAKPAFAEFTLRAVGDIPSVMALIDLKPLTIPSAAGLAPDVADGRAQIVARLGLELRKGLAPEDVSYAVEGHLRDVRSGALVPGRTLAAKDLTLRASPAEIAISGAASLDGVPLQGGWRMTPGSGPKGQSRVEGTIELSQRANAAFGIGLPEGTLSGAAQGAFGVDLAKGEAPRFTLQSDLNRLGLRLAGWSKAQNATGTLAVEGTLGAPATIERLDLAAPGLRATGTVSLRPDGGLESARFSQVQLGGWLDAPVVLTGRGAGRMPAVSIPGGTVDLRATALTGGGGGPGGLGNGAAGLGTVEVALDRLQVSDGIALNGVRGRISGQGGLNGQLTATVEGGAPLVATLAPAPNGTAIRIRAEDAAGVLRGAGIFRRARGGALDLVLTPEAAAGHYDGRVRIDDIRVKGVPALAKLLSAISVVGILEQLDGDGLLFSDVDARLRLTPGAVEIRKASAIGPSLGISLAGVYDTQAKRMDMQGVISPFYLVNSIGSVLTRKGEGLFGFNYRLAGAVENPDVRVNPLSILTPGMFRNIFRGPAPKVPQ